ncbi:hypothetical protein PMI27_001593 [Pseudomonas sp. GM41(2012)]|jgi:hypothetical protein|uniref:hypothetical protein n=1 Tax=Pseudomonas sp. (strain GM41(2012)) TaxID=1144708 RepID=UPI00026FD711|nr:hypothetical protein [Pseudomonas sp. GM41(2012)]EUB75417.1 hypothetical protein PMI27_001593 [Pseudomonas sp. GM41(2012)]
MKTAWQVKAPRAFSALEHCRSLGAAPGTMLNLPGTRAEQINAMRAKGIAIEDRMND